MAQRRLIQAIFDNEKLVKATQASEQGDTSLENVADDVEAEIEVAPRSEQFQNAVKQFTAVPIGRPRQQKNVFRRVWASFKSWKLAPSYGLLQELSCRKAVRDDDEEVVVVEPSTVEIAENNIVVVDAENGGTKSVPVGADLPPLLVEGADNVEFDSAANSGSNESPEPEDEKEDDTDAEIELAMSTREPSPEPREVRSRHRHADVVLRTLPNVVRGNQCVSWQLDHRPLFIAPLRSESPRPKLSSNQTHPKKPAKLLHDLVLEQQHADRVRQEQEASRRVTAEMANERVDDVRHGNRIKLVTMKEKIAQRNQRQEQNRAEQERCKTANAQRDSLRVQSARVGKKKRVKHLKEATVEKAKRAETNLAAQKDDRTKKMEKARERRQKIAAQAAKNEREGKRVPAAVSQCVSNRAAGFKSSVGGRTFAPSALSSASAFRRATLNFSSNSNGNCNNNNNGGDDILERSLSSESVISTGNSFEDDDIDLFGDITVAPNVIDRPLPTADELVLDFERQDREFEDDDDFFGTGGFSS